MTMAIRHVFLALVALVAAAVPAFAQIDVEQCTSYQRRITAVVKDESGADVNLVDIGQTPHCFMLFAAGQDRLDRNAFKAFVARLEGSRADKQTSASTPTAGGTSPVAQGPAARVLSVAADYGVLTQTVSKRVVTVRGNLAGLPTALVQKDIFPYCAGNERLRGYCVEGSALGILKRFSFSVSFDPSRPQALNAQSTAAQPAAADTQPVTFTGNSREISAYGGRVEIWNRRNASTPEFADAWKKKVGAALDTASAELLATAGDLVGEVMDLKEYEDWRKASLADVRAANKDRAKVAAALTSALTKLVAVASKEIPDFDSRLTGGLNAYSRFFLAQDELIEPIAKKNVLAFEYTHARPALQASTSNYRFIFDHPFSKKTTLVANAAFTFYDSVPAGQTIVKKYRDAQAGAELDHSLGDVAILGPAVLSVAAYYQYQHSPALLTVDPATPLSGVTFVGLPTDAKKVFTNTGNIILVQTRLSLVPTGSAVKVPLSITWSNRTELIDKPALRGQIGISYDLDSLFAGLGR
jgi:hypothetical protein